LSNVQRRHGRP